MAAVPIDDVQGEIYLHLCTQVGHLFLTFATLEGVLQTVLKLHMAENISGDSGNTKAILLAAAVYGSMRFSASRDTIKRIAAAERSDPAKVAFLETLFSQVKAIQHLRDMLAHQQLTRATDRIDGKWRLSNMYTTKTVSKPLIYEFDMVAINAASGDLQVITNRIGQSAVTDSLIDAVVTDMSPITWRFKSSMLKLVPLDEIEFPSSPTV